MHDQTSDTMAFRKAPPPVEWLIAAVLEPALAVLVFQVLSLWQHAGHSRAGFILCLMVFALTFPGRNRFHTPSHRVAIEIAASWLAVLVVLVAIGYASESLGVFPLPVLFAWAGLVPFFQWGAVVLIRRDLARRAAQSMGHRRVVIIGSGSLGARVAQAMKASPDPGCELVGFFDDRTDERVTAGLIGSHLGALALAAPYIRDHEIDEVRITLPLGSQARMLDLIAQLQGTTASIFFVPDLTGLGVIQGRLQLMNGLPVVGICETPFTGTNRLVKRLSDIVLASGILVLIAPILLAVALGVKHSGPGPVIFKQRRHGLDGKEIIVYKFRSMRTMDDGAHVPQATRGDPRLTPFGAFIRRTSLDELPQFVNVLQGRMSVVGPRPHAVAHNDLYRPLIKAYMVRHKVKPGITGWAQVNGHRGETDTLEKMQARVDHDLAYLQNWSLRLDLMIIWRTIGLVVFDRKAF
jgi:putative colanic acid biosynthesis UDP-glucose lipid carrier transferase